MSPATNRLEVDSEDIVDIPSVPPPAYSPVRHNRPRLPEADRNPRLQEYSEDNDVVKFQTIVREKRQIVIGRLKVRRPKTSSHQPEHAFILRRYDTGAISLTTLFKVAFPTATAEDEKRETDWVRSSYEIDNMNGNGQNDIVRLAGVWVSPKVAKSKLIGPLYGVQNLIDAIARAEPEDGMEYRKSQRSQAAYDDLVRQDKGPAATASTSGTPRPKRARRSSATPVADDASTSAGTPSASGSRVRVEATTTVTAPAGATIDMIAEIESAKKLVRDLKRELQMRAEAGEDVEETSSSRGTKRTGNTEEAANSTGAPRFAERQIATNKRVQGRGQTVKRAAFGAVLFGLGATAAMWFPQIAELASNYL